MTILYHLTVLPPKLPAAEALSQEIAALRGRFGGEIIYLNPNIGSPLYVPRLLFGWHKLRQIWQQEPQISLHHVYNPDPYPFSVLRAFRRPVVYSLSSGVGDKRPNVRLLSQLAAVVVPDERSFERLRGWGLTNVHLVRAGVEHGRFSYTPQPLTTQIRLLVASAPWTKGQFQSKGIDALLALAQKRPDISLIFLWRDVLYAEMMGRVADKNLDRRVQVINQLVDVNEILATVHATVNLATAEGIVKAQPHSLLDSLAAGKPVLVSQAIPLADFVAQAGCGEVVQSVTPVAIEQALEKLMANYEARQVAALQAGQANFSHRAMLDAYEAVYKTVLSKNRK